MNTTMDPRILALAQQLKQANKPKPLESTDFLDVLAEQNLSAAFSNGMSLHELTGFLKKNASENPSL